MSESKEKPEDCDGCGFETPHLTLYEDWVMRRGSRCDVQHWLCQLCANTKCGNALKYPEQYPNNDVIQAICYVGNAIIAAVTKNK